jgi:serine/threonine protein kinase
MKALRHPNVVQLHEVMQTANHIYLVLEVVTGGELFDKIVSVRKFDEATARKYFQQLIAGVQYCHDQGIAHRDIKPENLLLDATDTLKISDFGLSNLQPMNKTGLLQTVCGTPNYVSPEVLKEKGYNGFVADAWSCGIVLFVMLAGYLPFDDINMNALFNKIERGDYRLARHFSDPVKDIISKLLCVDPVKRLTIDGVIKHPWFQVDLDKSILRHDSPKVAAPSAQQVASAIQDTKEDGEDTSVSPGESALSPPGGAASPNSKPVAASGDATIDAFQVISRLTSGALNPCMTASTEVGIVRKVTYLLIDGTAKDVVSTFQMVSCNTKMMNGEIKGFFNGSNGLLTFTATVIQTSVADRSLVEIKRGRGDIFEFQTLIKQFCTAFGAKLRSQLVEE